MTVTVILLSYKRVQNIPAIVESIKLQSVKTKLILWNNNPELQLDNSMFGIEPDVLVNSPKNLFCKIRWEIARDADTDYVLIMDDDLYFGEPDALAHLIRQAILNYEENRLFGVEGVILDDDLNYFNTANKEKIVLHKMIPDSAAGPVHFAKPAGNLKVDVVKGRLILMKRDDLFAMGDVPGKYADRADDITYSLWMGNKKRNHLLIGGCENLIKDFPNKNDENSLSSDPHWKHFRNDAVKYLTDLKLKSARALVDIGFAE